MHRYGRKRARLSLPAVEWRFNIQAPEGDLETVFMSHTWARIGKSRLCHLGKVRAWLGAHSHVIRWAIRDGLLVACVRKSVFPIDQFASW